MPRVLIILLCPKDSLRTMGETAAREVGWRIRFLPRYIVDDFKALLVQCNPNTVNIMESAADPYRSIGSKNRFTEPYPVAVKFMFGFEWSAFVPFPLVHRDHATRMAGDTIVAEEIRRIGKNHINWFRLHSRQQRECIAEQQLFIFGLIIRHQRLSKDIFHRRRSFLFPIVSDNNFLTDSLRSITVNCTTYINHFNMETVIQFMHKVYIVVAQHYLCS